MGAVVAFYVATIGLLAPLMTCVGVGAIWGKKDYPFAGAFVTVLVTSITTPALVFETLVTTELDNAVLAEVFGSAVLAIFVCGALCGLVLRAFGQPVRKLLPTACVPNAGNLGLPVSHLAFGDVGLSAAVAFFAVVSFLQHTVGVRVLPGTADRAAGGWKSPVLVSAVAAVIVRVLGLPVPAWVIDSVHLLGSLTVPLMLLSLGHALAMIPSSGLKLGAWLAALRLTAGLIAGVGTAWALGLPGDLAGVLILQMGMPCAVVSYMYSRRYTDMGDTSAGAVLVSTVAFLVLAPFFLWLTTGQ